MTWYPDLSPYGYGLEPASWGAEGPPGVEPEALYAWMWDPPDPDGAFPVPELNVGWLDPPHEFPRGALPAELVEKLDALCLASRYHQTRGQHPCGFCHGRAARGSAEIRIAGDGVVYAAPTLVAHYVAAHEYAPPDEFVRALRDCDGLAQADPSLRRPVTADMVPRAPVPLDALQARVLAAIEDEYRQETFPEVALRGDGDHVVVDASIVTQRGRTPVARTWRIPLAALANPEQAASGIETMLSRAHVQLVRHEEEP